MEVKSGYKQTEVGVIPQEWEVRRLGSLGSVIRGASPRPKGDKRYYGGDVPRLMVEDVTRDKKLVTPRIDSLTPEGAKLSRPCKRGTLTVVCSGTPGVVGLPSFLAVDACIHDGMIALVNMSPKVVPDYLFHQLTSYQERLYMAATHGGTFVNLTTSGFRAFEIALPPREAEQRAIATTLSDLDALLDALDRLIGKKRDLKQAALKQLLTGQSRLPGFQGEWEVKQLGNVIEKLVGGGTPSRSDSAYWGNEIPWATVKDFATFNPYQTQESITRVGLKNSASHLIPAGTLITSTRMALGKAVIYQVDVAINQDLKAVFLKAGSNVLFVYYWFVYNAQAIDDLGNGSTVKGISIAELKSIPFPLFSLTEQTAIAAVLSDMDVELATLEQQRDKTRALKQAMMQELLTGKTRLVSQKGNNVRTSPL